MTTVIAIVIGLVAGYCAWNGPDDPYAQALVYGHMPQHSWAGFRGLMILMVALVILGLIAVGQNATGGSRRPPRWWW